VARGGRHYGTLTGSVTVDMATVRQRKREMVDRQIANHLQIYRTSGAELIMGSGRFLAPKTLEVNLNDGRTRVLSGDKVFLNVGTHAALPDVPGLEAAQPLTHVEALDLDYLPQHLIVIGGGYSGLELGTGVSSLRQPCHRRRVRSPDHGSRGHRRVAGDTAHSRR
jgi:pyruvate/2-oxoglutarate dehydrogenase complex dihydrolipoamide dehydrogenase (E3) component